MNPEPLNPERLNGYPVRNRYSTFLEISLGILGGYYVMERCRVDGGGRKVANDEIEANIESAKADKYRIIKGKSEAVATPFPLSQYYLFPIFIPLEAGLSCTRLSPRRIQ